MYAWVGRDNLELLMDGRRDGGQAAARHRREGGADPADRPASHSPSRTTSARARPGMNYARDIVHRGEPAGFTSLTG